MKKNFKALGFLNLKDWQKPVVRKSFRGQDIYFDWRGRPEIAKKLEVLSIFVDYPVTAKTLTEYPNLRFLTTRSTGFDHIDLEACRKRKVLAAYVPGYGDNTVAEYAFGLMLSLVRKIPEAVARVKNQGFFPLENLRGTDLRGKTLGVIGTGRIGKQVVKIARGFGIRVLAFDPVPDRAFGKREGLTYRPLTKVLQEADIVTIHCPHSKQTHHLVNRQNIRFFKRGAYLVNTARGGIVSTSALVWALQKGILAGAALDVLEEEGEMKDELKLLTSPHPSKKRLETVLENHVLLKMPNVLVTPHNAFNTREALDRILDTTIENIKAYLSGRPINLVKLP